MIIYLLAATFDFFLAGFVLWNSRGATALAFSALAACAGIWSVELMLLNTVSDIAILSPWFHVTRLGLFFIAPLLMIFHALITRTPIVKGLRLLIGASLAVSLALALANVIFYPTRLVAVASGFSPAVDVIYVVYAVNFGVSCIATISITVRAYRRAIFRERMRLKWLAAGIAVGCLMGMLSFKYPKHYVGTAGSVISLCCIAYAVVRHRLISVGAAVGNGTIRLVALGLLGGAYAAANFLFSQLTTAMGELLFLQSVSFIAALEAFPRLTRLLRAQRDRYYFANEYNYELTTDRVLKALKNCSSLDTFAQLCNEVFLHLVRADSYSVHLTPCLYGGGVCKDLVVLGLSAAGWSPKKAPISAVQGTVLGEVFSTLRETIFYDEAEGDLKDDFVRLKASALVPIRRGDETVGFFLLGAPLKPEQFSYDDIRLLNWFGTEVGPVLENLLAFIRLESSLTEAEKTLSVVSRLNEYNHDVKTPFSNIEALLLAGDAFSPEERQARILDQVRRGHQLVATMTALLKGGHRNRRTMVDLNAVIQRVVASFPAHAHAVQVSPAAGLPAVEACEEELEILISNLLSNAFAARDKARHQVRVWTWFDAEAGRIGCCVQDNGRGIAPDRLPGLWTGLASDRRAEGGTGLGLSVVKRIVDDHGGRIVVSSEPGVGTEFSLSLPVAARSTRTPGVKIHAV